MRCLKRTLTLLCAGLSLSSCTLFRPPPPPIIDGYCRRYNKVIVEKGDGDIKASLGVKRRLLANELTYKEQCPPKE